MLTTDRETPLDRLLGTAIADFDIPDDVYQRAVRRYEDVGVWLSEHWSAATTDGIVYPQGSFRLGTVVQPINPRDEYDIDLVCRRDVLKTSTTQAALKLDVGRGLASYTASGPDGSPTRAEGKRCWTLNYPAEPFHIDALPAIPDTEGVGDAILLTDKGLREWQHSNPIDYAGWFHGVMSADVARLRDAVAKRMEVADVPEWRVKTPLQRAVQALKRHRDLHFAKRPKDRPASIIVSTLAAMAYVPGGSIYDTLVDVTRTMPSLVEVRGGVHWVANPVHPDENFADRWQRHPESDRRFFEWIEAADADFSAYGADLGVDRVLEKFAGSFGEGPAWRAGEIAAAGVTTARNASLLAIGSTGLLGAATSRPTPPHTFHGDAPRTRRS